MGDITDVESLFDLLDNDQSGTIDVSEFLQGCFKLKGEASGLSMALVGLKCSWLMHNMALNTRALENITGMLSPVHTEIVKYKWSMLADDEISRVNELFHCQEAFEASPLVVPDIQQGKELLCCREACETMPDVTQGPMS